MVQVASGIAGRAPPENDSGDEQNKQFLICNELGSSSSTDSSGVFMQRTSTSIRKSLRRLESSSRLVSVCSGSDLTQLYLSSPEEVNPLANSTSFSSGIGQSIDMYGRKKSFRRLSSFANFLDEDCGLGTLREGSSSFSESDVELFIDDDRPSRIGSAGWRSYQQMFLVPALMLIDLTLGIGLSLYDSNLLRNVDGFDFPLCYALVQKATNATASLVLIVLSRRWEAQERAKTKSQQPLTDLPSIGAFRHHFVPLTAVALVQTISAAFANKSLQIVPLPLFKVCLMCGPIFVAAMSSLVERQFYSAGRNLSLLLIGVGALKSVYSEAEVADNPRIVMVGSGYALTSSLFSGIGLVLSSVLMHRSTDQKLDGQQQKPTTELNPLSLLFYLSCEQMVMLGVFLSPWALLTHPEIAAGGEFSKFVEYMDSKPWLGLSYLMTGSFISLFLAVLTFFLVNKTSPVATSLLGNVRSISTVAISSIVFGNSSSRSGGLFGSAAFGYVVTLAGGVCYAIAALSQK
mmetsp:Transcript_35378/g.84521  ORF Transcript_35378/g.84521 Transcript_35378/m.84521 type:complete len:517 (+) Transcript_35378:151-1701(+)